MAALEVGKKAPDFSLPDMDGKSFSLQGALARGPVVIAFFKISCPVCQFTFPYLERIYQAYGDKNVTIVGVSQNDRQGTAAFNKEYEITFPVLLDGTDSYPVSNAYGLTNVPTVFWIDPDGSIEISSVGWVKQEIAEINQKIAEAGQQKLQPVFMADESVPAYRPG